MAGIFTDTFAYVSNLLSSLATKIIVAVVILLIGFILGRVLGRLTQKGLHELELDRVLKQGAGITVSSEKIIGSFIKYFTYFIFIVMALNQLGLTTTLLNMVSGAVLLVIILSIFLGIKDFVPNLLAGAVIYRKRLVTEGDRIKVRGVEGKVISIDLLETKVETRKKDIIHLPNSLITKEELVVKRRKK